MRLLCLIFLFLPLNLVAQTFPVDAASGKIYYAEEVLVKDGPKTDLYNRAKAWFAAPGKNGRSLRVDDAVHGLFIGQNFLFLSVYDGQKKQTFKLWYTLKLELEDDRYWYSITDLKLQAIPQTKGLSTAGVRAPKEALETWVLTQAAGVKKNKILNKSLTDAAHHRIHALIEDLKASML